MIMAEQERIQGDIAEVKQYKKTKVDTIKREQ